MKRTIHSLPNWTFDIDEVSSGVYTIIAKHSAGPTIELKGTDPEQLMEKAKISAEHMESELKNRTRKPPAH